jgi:hypothetical protein
MRDLALLAAFLDDEVGGREVGERAIRVLEGWLLCRAIVPLMFRGASLPMFHP